MAEGAQQRMREAGSTNLYTAKAVEVDSDVDADPDTFGFLAEGALAKNRSRTTLTSSGRETCGGGNFADNVRSRLQRERVLRIVALPCSERGIEYPRCVRPVFTFHGLISLAGGNQYDYLCTLLEAEPFEKFLSTLDMQEMDEFERVWGLYEWRQNTDPQAMVPFLAFLLRRGVLLKAPALTTKNAEDCVASVQLENVTTSFSTLADGQWNIDDPSSQYAAQPLKLRRLYSS